MKLFDNTQVAFALKTDSQLERAYFLFKMIQNQPMVRIGTKPILMHIIDNYVEQGYIEFVLCLGYKSNTIINYFLKERKKNIKILFKDKTHIKFEYNNKKK